jgi:hypothetical protein
MSLFGPNFSLGGGLFGFGGGDITIKSKLSEMVPELGVGKAYKLYLKLKGFEKMGIRFASVSDKEDKRRLCMTLIDGELHLIQEGNPDFKPIDWESEAFERFLEPALDEINSPLQQALLEDLLTKMTAAHLKELLRDL